jgi:hypothetical protein
MRPKFQILDKDGNPISISVLDVDVAIFWNKPVSSKHYVSPGKEENMFMNWFDRIGGCIENQGHYTSGWDNIIHELWKDCQSHFFDNGEFLPLIIDTETSMDIVLPDSVKTGLLGQWLYNKPYMDLINYWKFKGYQPKKID